MKKILTFCILLIMCLVFMCACQNNKLIREKEYDNYDENGKAYSVNFSFIGEYKINSEGYRAEFGKVYSLPTSEIINELNQNIVSEKIDAQINDDSTLFISYGKEIEKVLVFPDTQGNIKYYIPNDDLKNKIVISEGVLSDEEDEKNDTIFLYRINMGYLTTGDDVEYLWF